MRLLFVSNFYPPVVYGGYEQLCREVAIALVDRGHTLGVLTGVLGGATSEPSGASLEQVRVYRRLHLEVGGGLLQTMLKLLRDRRRLERENLEQIRAVLADFRPDAVLIWGMWNVPRSVPALIEELCPARVAYYICDYWPSLPSAYLQRWQAPASGPFRRVLKRLIAVPFTYLLANEPSLPLSLEHAYCVSRAVREILVRGGVGVRDAGVIYGNARPEQFACHSAHSRSDDATELVRLLYAGRLAPEKGIHTAIRAISLLVPGDRERVRLDVVGQGDAGYETSLRGLVRQLRLDRCISFKGGVPRSQMPSIFGEHDVLIFPSEWDEPFSRAVLEAMAAGLVVVGTTTGGTGEVLEDGRTGLTFQAGNPAALAAQLQRLAADPALHRRLAAEGRRRVSTDFTFDQTVDGIEQAVARIVDQPLQRARELVIR